MTTQGEFMDVKRLQAAGPTIQEIAARTGISPGEASKWLAGRGATDPAGERQRRSGDGRVVAWPDRRHLGAQADAVGHVDLRSAGGGGV